MELFLLIYGVGYVLSLLAIILFAKFHPNGRGYITLGMLIHSMLLSLASWIVLAGFIAFLIAEYVPFDKRLF